MKVTTTIGIVGIVAGLGVVVYLLSKAGGASALNPASQNNLAYRGANSLLQAVTGNPVDTVGTSFWSFLNPTQAAVDNSITALTGPTITNPLPSDFGITKTESWGSDGGGTLVPAIPLMGGL